MPTYEYRCTSCGHRFDVVQRLDERPLQVCERCGGALRKVFHPAGIVFKGSGFYATDSRRPAKTGADKAGGDRPSGDRPSGDRPSGDRHSDRAPSSSSEGSTGSAGSSGSSSSGSSSRESSPGS